MRRLVELSSLWVVIGIIFITLVPSSVHAAEFVMFEQAGCPWCQAFDREVAPGYVKSEEGLRAPLRRVDIDKPLPPDLSFIQVERLTPLFVLIDNGREIGLRGYPGVDGFWMQLAVLFGKLDAEGTRRERVHGI